MAFSEIFDKLLTDSQKIDNSGEKMKTLSNEKRAQNLLEKLERPSDTRPYQRPFFMEVTGSPSSGKSTMIDILDPFFRRQGYRVYTPQEGAEVIRHISRDTHLYNVRTGLYALTTLIDCSVNPNYDLVIFDRCIYDAYSWMENWGRKTNEFVGTQKHTLQDFFLYPLWKSWMDAVFFVVTNSEEAIRRDQKVSLTKKLGKTTNSASITNLVNIFTNTYDKFKKHKNVFFIDTSGLSQKKMTKLVLEKALKAMEDRF